MGSAGSQQTVPCWGWVRPGEEEAERKIDDEEKEWCDSLERSGQDVEADGGEAEGG